MLGLTKHDKFCQGTLLEYNNLTSTEILKVGKSHVYPVDFDKSSRFNGLYYASFSTIHETAVSLMAIGSCGINKRDYRGTLLVWLLGMSTREL